MNYRSTVHFSTSFSTTSFAAIPQTKLPDSDGDHLLRSDADLLPEQHRLFDSSLQKEWVYFVDFVEIFGVSALCHRG
jgi:hypothetical protein